MGQKVNPIGLRLGINKTWASRWYQKKGYADLLLEDLKLRNQTEKLLGHAEVEKVELVRVSEKVNVNIHTAKPGVVIGKRGEDVEKLKIALQKLTEKKLHINIIEVKEPFASAVLISREIAKKIEGRISHKKAMKQGIQDAVNKGNVKGIKIIVSGRLGGAEMARREVYKEGRVPLHTLRADIDYGVSTAHTTFGCIGVKVWIFKGEIYDDNLAHLYAEEESNSRTNNRDNRRRNRR